jgi:hypothetical protein
MTAPSSVSPTMVVAVVFVALIIIVLMFVFRRQGYQPLPMAAASLQPNSLSIASPPLSGSVKNVWRNLANYKLPADQSKVTTYHPRKKGDTIVSLQEAISLCKKNGYCERVQTDGDNYIFINWPKSCQCAKSEPCTCSCPSFMDYHSYFVSCNVDPNTGLPFYNRQYNWGHYLPAEQDRMEITDYDLGVPITVNKVIYNNGILPYNPSTGYTLYPYNPYTGNRLIDAGTNLPVAIDELGLARFSWDKSPWYEILDQDFVTPPCVNGSRTGLPDNIFFNAEKSYFKQHDSFYVAGPGLPINAYMDLNRDEKYYTDGTLKAGFDKSKVQRFNEDVNNLPKHPKTRLPLYPYNPYTGKAIIDPKTGQPVKINADDGLAKFTV